MGRRKKIVQECERLMDEPENIRNIAIAAHVDNLRTVFIRAPVVDEAGDDVEVLAEFDGRPVAVRQDNVVGTAFHPELTDDSRIHGLAFFGSD